MAALNALSSLQRQHGYNQQASLGTWAGNAQHKNLLPGYKKPLPINNRSVGTGPARPLPPGLSTRRAPVIIPQKKPMMASQGWSETGPARPNYEQTRYPIMNNTQGLQIGGNQQQDFYNLLQMLMRGGNQSGVRY